LTSITLKLGVVGAGHVGLVTAAGLADLGYSVTLYDIDARRIDALQRGEMPMREPLLSELVAANVRRRLAFTADALEAVKGALAIFVADHSAVWNILERSGRNRSVTDGNRMRRNPS